MRRVRVMGVLVAVLATAATAFSGQTVSATTGAINGKVVDASGGVLPGVTVTISSPAMQGVQTDVTNAEGSYRFPALPPGEYKLVFELVGFATLVREGIRVSLGFTATVNVDLRVAGLEETVTVKGESPVVDVQSTRTTTSFDSRLLASLPNARDMWAVLAEAPAVQVVRIDVGGSTAGTQTGYNAYDAQGGQNRVMIDGMVTTEGSAAIGVYVDYGSFDEISVGMAGHGAEMGWPGFQTQMIAKSGGNEYHGSIYADYQNESIQAHNVDAEQITRGAESREANRMHAYRDFNADAGGFIRKDKIWWYGSYRNFNVEARYANFPVKPHQTALQHYTGKATFSLPRNNKLIVFQTATRKFQPTRLDAWRIGNAINRTVESTESQEHWAWVGKVEWNKVLGDALFFEIRGGQFGYNWPLKPQPGAKSPRVEDIGNNLVSGNNRDWLQSRRRNQVLGSLSFFKDDWGGDHNFKFGGEIFHETWLEEWYEGAYFNGVISYLRNGVPVEVDLFELPGHSVGGLMTYSAYANDIWRVSNRLTLTPGLRFDRYRNYLPEQEHPAGPFSPVATTFPAVDELTNWNLFGPRLGATYDIQGNGKTVAKFNYGQYWWNPSVLTGPNPNSSPWYKRYTWSDLNGNGVWDRGEEGRLISTQGGVAAESINPELENAFTREVSAWVERELMPNFGIRTGLVFRGIQQQYGRYNARQPFAAFNVPVQIPDPGPDGVTGTSDDGPAIAGFNLDPSLVGLPSMNIVDNAEASGKYYTWEISGNRRMVGRWSLMAAFTYRWNQDNSGSYFGNAVRSYAVPRTPNDLINTDTTDGAYKYRTWTVKFNSTIEAPWGLKLTPMLRHQAGQPWGRTFLGRFNYGSIRVLAEPIGTHRQDNITIFDLRTEKVFRLPKGYSVSGFLDIYNLFNANAAVNIIWSSGSSFQRPTTITPPRIVRFGAKFQW